jgi:nucleoside-diphosphate-sugar epimerase
MIAPSDNPRDPAHVLIAGCGDIGIGLAARLHDAGHRVSGLRRNTAALPNHIEPIEADLAQPESFPVPAPGFDYLVYTASADSYSESAYRRAYVDGLRTLLAWLDQAGRPANRLVFASSTSVYSEDRGGWVDEDSPVRNDHFGPANLLEAERMLDRHPTESVVVRFGGIYGPGRTALIDRVLRGEARCVRGNYTNRIHRDDCAAVLAHLLTVDEPERAYLAVDSDPAPACEVQRWLAARLNAPEPTVIEPTAPAAGRGPRNKRCSNQRLLATGFKFRFPGYRDGYETLVPSGK